MAVDCRGLRFPELHVLRQLWLLSDSKSRAGRWAMRAVPSHLATCSTPKATLPTSLRIRSSFLNFGQIDAATFAKTTESEFAKGDATMQPSRFHKPSWGGRLHERVTVPQNNFQEGLLCNLLWTKGSSRDDIFQDFLRAASSLLKAACLYRACLYRTQPKNLVSKSSLLQEPKLLVG
eukprot:5695728-Amphidinium_carterae.1